MLQVLDNKMTMVQVLNSRMTTNQVSDFLSLNINNKSSFQLSYYYVDQRVNVSSNPIMDDYI